jgi:hypothetical protein
MRLATATEIHCAALRPPVILVPSRRLGVDDALPRLRRQQAEEGRLPPGAARGSGEIDKILEGHRDSQSINSTSHPPVIVAFPLRPSKRYEARTKREPTDERRNNQVFQAIEVELGQGSTLVIDTRCGSELEAGHRQQLVGGWRPRPTRREETPSTDVHRSKESPR